MWESARTPRRIACFAVCLTTWSVASPMESAAKRTSPAPVQECAICPELIRIAAGSFERADDPNPWVRALRVARDAAPAARPEASENPGDGPGAGRGEPHLPADLADPSDTLVVRPGDSAVQAERIREYEVVWTQYFETDRGRTLRRTIVDRVERERGPDRELVVRSQTFLGLDGSPTSERVNHVDGMTLTPVRERWKFGERVTHVDYDGVRVSGATLDGAPGTAALVFDERLQEPGFDFNTMPLILAALALEPDLEFRLPHVRISPPAFPVPEIAWATIHVEGPERVDAGPLGEVEAWRAVDPEHDMMFWLIPESPYLVKVAFPIDASTRSIMELGAVLAGGDSG